MKDGGPRDQSPPKAKSTTEAGALFPTRRPVGPIRRLARVGGIPGGRGARILLLAVYVGLVFFLSCRPRTRPPLELPHADKAIHMVEYGVLGWLLAGVLDPRARLRPGGLLFGVLLAALVVGVLDELNQSRIPGRDSSAWDLAADVVGASLAAILWLRVRWSGT